MARPGPNWLDRLQRAVADEDPNVWSLDVDASACPFLPICDPIVDGRVTYWNNAHLTRRYAGNPRPGAGQILQGAGVDPRLRDTL